jgi:hypothetical protein
VGLEVMRVVEVIQATAAAVVATLLEAAVLHRFDKVYH